MATVDPRISIGMPVYGGEKHLRASIQSVIDQDFSNWELIVLDDASPDRSVDVIQTFQDQRIRLLRNVSNQGLVAARNRIMDEARGEFLAWLDQDDLAAPGRLSSQIRFLDRHPHISVCGSFTETLLEQEGIPSQLRLDVFPEHHNQIRSALPFFNPMACNTVTMRLEDFREHNLRFRPEFGNSLDYDMWSQASDRLFFENIALPLGIYRVHPQQTSRGTALVVMNQHAIRVQVELIERSLNIPMTANLRSLHASATIAPLSIQDADHLIAIADWFATLRDANTLHRSFDTDSFDGMLIRQWTTCLLAARGTVNTPALARVAARGFKLLKPKLRPAIESVLSGARRRRMQRSRPAVPGVDFR